jgi:hypothetical protein
MYAFVPEQLARSHSSAAKKDADRAWTGCDLRTRVAIASVKSFRKIIVDLRRQMLLCPHPRSFLRLTHPGGDSLALLPWWASTTRHPHALYSIRVKVTILSVTASINAGGITLPWPM